ncbi:MAG: rod shape-determining protein [Victivallis sp.]
MTQHLRKVYNLMIGELTAEQIKIASAAPTRSRTTKVWRSRASTSCRVCRRLSGSRRPSIRMALQEPVTTIIEAVRATLERCPPDLAADLIDRGIMLAGGGAMLSGLDKLLTEETGLPVFISEEPLHAGREGNRRDAQGREHLVTVE